MNLGLLVGITFVVCLSAIVAHVFSMHAVGPNAPRMRPKQALDPQAFTRSIHGEIWRAVMTAFLIRLVLGVIIVGFGWDFILAPDAVEYADFGAILAQYWEDGVRSPFHAAIMQGGHGRWVTINAVVFYLFGDLPFLLVVPSALAGAATVYFAARIALHLAGPQAGSWTAWLVALFPSLILWSSINLRDPYMILGVTAIAWCTIQIKHEVRPLLLAQLAFWLAMIGLFREYLFVIVAGGVTIGFAVGGKEHPVRSYVGAIFALVVVALLAQSAGFGRQVIEEATFERITEIRRGHGIGASSAYLQGYVVTSVWDAIRLIPLGIWYFLFSPFPWATSGIRQILTVPEMLFWYWMFPRVLRGMKLTFGVRPGGAWILAALTTAVTLAYSLISGNIGTAYRHRAQILPLLLVLGGVAMAMRPGWRQKKANVQRTTRLGAPAPVGSARVTAG